ncbi:hypothetical protein [Moraxella lacunata]
MILTSSSMLHKQINIGRYRYCKIHLYSIKYYHDFLFKTTKLL